MAAVTVSNAAAAASWSRALDDRVAQRAYVNTEVLLVPIRIRLRQAMGDDSQRR